MIEILTWWEIALVGAVVLLAVAEAVAMGVARWQGRTRNLTRLVSHALIACCAIVYGWLMLRFSASLAGVDWINFSQAPDDNWPYLVALAAIGVLVSHELISHLRAIREGRTRNVSRLMSRGVMLLLLVLMVGINEVRWQLYLDHLKHLGETQPPAAVFVPQSR